MGRALAEVPGSALGGSNSGDGPENGPGRAGRPGSDSNESK